MSIECRQVGDGADGARAAWHPLGMSVSATRRAGVKGGRFALVRAALAGVAVCACRSPRFEIAPGALTASARAATSLQASPSAESPYPVKEAASARTADAPPERSRAQPPRVATEWCISGLDGLDEETCYVLPEGGARAPEAPRALLIYLHGIVPPVASSPQKERVETAVLHAARRAGAAALVPRGLRGIGPGSAHDWWAWPTEPTAYAKHAAALVAKWADARRRLEGVVGAPFARVYLAGSSNGAYFLTTLALRGDLERLGFAVDGYGAISGGSATGLAASALPKARPPFYVGYGAYDAASGPGARALSELLTRAGWPTKRAEHPVGHGAREEYLDEAFAFWGVEAM